MPVKFKTLFILAHLSVLCSGVGRDSWPGYEYYAKIHGYFKLHPEPENWLVARINCHDEDALLTSPWNDEFKSAMHELLSNDSLSFPVLFSGALISFPEGAYRNYVEWLPGILMDLERCGVFFADGSTGDVSCRMRLPYVCYAPATGPPPAFAPAPAFVPVLAPRSDPQLNVVAPTPAPTSAPTPKPASTPSSTSAPTPTPTPTLPPTPAPTTTTTPAPSCALDYEFSEQTGHCYKFHTQSVGWLVANSTCVAEGGSLAVADDEDEETFLIELFEDYPASAIRSENTGFVSVGIYKDSDGWKTVDGQVFEQDYFEWVPGQPLYQNSDFFVFMRRDGKLDNSSILAQAAFICEMTPSPMFDLRIQTPKKPFFTSGRTANS